MPSDLTLQTQSLMSRAHYAILQGSMSVKDLSGDHYTAQLACLDRSILHLSRGKWLYGRATGELADFALRSFSVDDLTEACKSFTQAIRIIDEISESTLAEQPVPADGITQKNELTWFQDTPIVPSICPLVILAGSSVDMGRQYASQCIEIFGPFIFEAFAEKCFSKAEKDHLNAWADKIRQFTPEVLDMATGIAEGASQCGIALSQDQALSLWIGTLQPATSPAPIGVLDAEGGGVMGAYFGNVEGAEPLHGDIGEGLCSGAAAWGSATKDGHLYFSSSTDHDCTFQVTIIAYPDEGYPFIYTPFSVNGSVPGVGRFGLAGHPGFNSAGLAYIHHGGGGACAENTKEWGYGIPKGASTFHVLRYAKSAGQAESMEGDFPIGNVGHVLGSPGGFYADDCGGFVYESRDRDKPVIRYDTQDTAGIRHQFLYATNNIISKNISSPVFPGTVGETWHPVQGWICEQADKADDAGLLTRRLWSVSAASRNQYLYDALRAHEGALDLQKMVSLFQQGPDVGAVTWGEAEADMNAGGLLPRHSAAHRLNAFVAAGAPADRKYLAAIGPITHRSVSPNRPGHGYFIYDETNAYWEVTLADSIIDMLEIAKSVACELAAKAEKAMGQALRAKHANKKTADHFKEIQALLATELPTFSDTNRTDKALSSASKCLRRYTRAQVRARQILQSLNPPEEWDIKRIYSS